MPLPGQPSVPLLVMFSHLGEAMVFAVNLDREAPERTIEIQYV